MLRSGFAKFCLLVGAVLATTEAAVAADVARGAQLAQRWCANCHVLGGKPPATIQQGPPSFHAIAQGNRTDNQLRIFLAHPHGGMPDLALSRSEITDLIGYIDTLR